LNSLEGGDAVASQRQHAGATNAPRSRAIRVRTRDIEAPARERAAERVQPPAHTPRPVADGLEPEAARRRDRGYRRLLGLADVVAMTLALAICIPLLGEDDALTPLVATGAVFILVLSKVLNLYDRDELLLHKSTLDEAPKLFQVATLMALLLWLSHPFLIDGELGRKQVLGYWLTLAALLPLLRVLARMLARRTTPQENCLLVGTSAACDQAREKIESGQSVHARVVAEVEMETAADVEDASAAVALLSQEHDIHRVVVAPPATDQGEVLNLIRASKALGLKVSVLPRMLEVVGSSVEFDDLDGLNVLGVRRFGLTRSSWLVKRSMDVVGSGVALVLLGPFLALIALAIKVDSRGPVLFRQERVGREGQIFEMLKFRTMVAGAEDQREELEDRNEADGLFKIEDDPRITRVGRLLRRTSFDELPQLVNVLRGEMSLVGPRPLVLADDQRVRGWYRRRLQLTPGMTGRWQVLGSARVPLGDMVKLDYLYVANWSVWGDMKILLRTVGFVLGRRGL
jgi:exopolysaccharide biosynthesis polyprenyl glycosylphosphotransferase